MARRGSEPYGRPQSGPSQRQLRAGELVRHALSDILAQGDAHDPELDSVTVTITEVRPTPDLRRADVYFSALGGVDESRALAALTRMAGRLRGLLGRRIEMKFTPELSFKVDRQFDRADRIDALLRRPDVRRDIDDPER